MLVQISADAFRADAFRVGAFRRVRSFAPLLLLILLGSSPLRAQLVVHLHQPPPNQLKARDLWVVDMTNLTQNTYKVYLHATAVEVSNPSNPISIADAQSAVFTLHPGFHFVTATDISPIKLNTADPIYTDIVTKTGDVPSGDYQVCVDVIDAANQAVLGRDCYDQVVDRTSPPILILPFDGSEVNQRYPNFAWLPPSPPSVGQQVSYKLRIVEVYPRQSPYDAMQSNSAWFGASNIYRTTYFYPISARSFTPGHSYAWQVTATMGFGARSFSLGASEVWQFDYAPQGTGDVGVGNTQTGAGSNLLKGSGPEDSTSLFDFWKSYSQDNLIDDRLLFGNVSTAPGSAADELNGVDPNAHSFVPASPNDTTRSGTCGRSPIVHFRFEYPSLSGNPANWQKPFNIDWSVVHGAPIDHVDLRIAPFGFEDAPIVHYVYRVASGSIATATTIDPRSFIVNPSANGLMLVVSITAIDAYGRSSGKVQQLYMDGSFSSPPPFLTSFLSGGAGFGGSTADPTITITSATYHGLRSVSYSNRALRFSEGASPTITVINHDDRPHHLASAYTPPYPLNASLPLGGVAPIDFGEIAPGASATATLPAGAPACYQWTLFDLDHLDIPEGITITIGAR